MRALARARHLRSAVRPVNLPPSPPPAHTRSISCTPARRLLLCIDAGNAVRSTGSTGANADSSRSHAVLQITLALGASDGAGGVMLRLDAKTGRARPRGP